MTSDDQQLINELAMLTDGQIGQVQSLDNMRDRLAAFINELAANNFEKLVGLLYRIDVNEAKLKLMIVQNKGTDVGYIVADAIIKRQQEKLATWTQYSKRNDDIPDEDRW
ncbi:MAG TPA: hypothetical protein PKM63_09855 [Panacibacter sp.]|nr:hypothetical protein [Panacibacter sp.]HNP44578.1 hypothetical protein [Panacibacter sp.]